MTTRWYLIAYMLALMTKMQGEETFRVVSWREFNLAKMHQILLTNRQRVDLVNYLIAKHNYRSYLEIGVERGDMFNLVMASHKVGVDPDPLGPCTFQMTSDEFFQDNRETFDIIFIDGMHLHEQVLRDVRNSLNVLNPGGTIVLHDCLPKSLDHQRRFPVQFLWNGDVWKAAAYIRMHFQDVHFCVVDMDWGCGIITPHSTQDLYPQVPIEQMDWDYFARNRDQLLNVMTVEEWLQKVNSSFAGTASGIRDPQ